MADDLGRSARRWLDLEGEHQLAVGHQRQPAQFDKNHRLPAFSLDVLDLRILDVQDVELVLHVLSRENHPHDSTGLPASKLHLDHRPLRPLVDDMKDTPELAILSVWWGGRGSLNGLACDLWVEVVGARAHHEKLVRLTGVRS